MNKALSLSKTEAKKVFDSHGMVRRSFLFNLRWFSNSYFFRFGLCHMYVSIEGNFTRHIKYVLVYTATWEQANKRAEKLSTTYPMLQFLKEGIVKMATPRGFGHRILTLRTFTAEQIETFLQVQPYSTQSTPLNLSISYLD